MNEILLLEDEQSVNRGICFTLEKAGYQVYACVSIEEARQVLKKHQPQMYICDLTLPDGNGLDFIKDVRQAHNNSYILCLTALDSEMDFVMGYGAGADDYMAKPFSLSVLTLKVQAYFGRAQKSFSSEIMFGRIRVNRDEMRALFLDHPNQILSKTQIIEQLFDAEGDCVEENTIAVMIRRLREKIEEDPARPQYIKNVRGMGYILRKTSDM